MGSFLVGITYDKKLLAVIFAGMIMMIFALNQTTVIIVAIMVILPLLLSFPAFILDSMENADIDQYGQAD